MTGSASSKICTCCGISKSFEDFHKNKHKPLGLQSACKVCASAKSLSWANANRERKQAYDAVYRSANRENLQAKAIAWHTKDGLTNPGKKRIQGENWRKANADKNRIYRHNRRALERQAGGRLSPELSKKLFVLQRGMCPCCKQPLGDDPHLDHIVPIARGGRNEDSNIQLLRATCNMQKAAKDPADFMRQRGFLL